MSPNIIQDEHTYKNAVVTKVISSHKVTISPRHEKIQCLVVQKLSKKVGAQFGYLKKIRHSDDEVQKALSLLIQRFKRIKKSIKKPIVIFWVKNWTDYWALVIVNLVIYVFSCFKHNICYMLKEFIFRQITVLKDRCKIKQYRHVNKMIILLSIEFYFWLNSQSVACYYLTYLIYIYLIRWGFNRMQQNCSVYSLCWINKSFIQ